MIVWATLEPYRKENDRGEPPELPDILDTDD